MVLSPEIIRTVSSINLDIGDWDSQRDAYLVLQRLNAALNRRMIGGFFTILTIPSLFSNRDEAMTAIINARLLVLHALVTKSPISEMSGASFSKHAIASSIVADSDTADDLSSYTRVIGRG